MYLMSFLFDFWGQLLPKLGKCLLTFRSHCFLLYLYESLPPQRPNRNSEFTVESSWVKNLVISKNGSDT